MSISKKTIHNLINATKEELKPYLQKLDFEKISKHNKGYLKYSLDPAKYFIDMEFLRYANTILYISNNFSIGSDILDFGFFIPVIPIILSKLGYHVTSIEKLSYYDGCLNELINFAKKYSIEVVDFDLIKSATIQIKKKFSLVLLQAVLEHLNGSPKVLLQKIKSFLNADGYIIVEVPNVGTLTNRLSFLFRGKPPYPDYKDYFNSDYPFSGHNREYTINDLIFALQSSSYEIKELRSFFQSNIKPKKILKLLSLLEKFGPVSWRPTLWAVAKQL